MLLFWGVQVVVGIACKSTIPPIQIPAPPQAIFQANQAQLEGYVETAANLLRPSAIDALIALASAPATASGEEGEKGASPTPAAAAASASSSSAASAAAKAQPTEAGMAALHATMHSRNLNMKNFTAGECLLPWCTVLAACWVNCIEGLHGG